MGCYFIEALCSVAHEGSEYHDKQMITVTAKDLKEATEVFVNKTGNIVAGAKAIFERVGYPLHNQITIDDFKITISLSK